MKTDQINEVQNRESRTTYTGVYKDFQTFGESLTREPYQQREVKSYSEYQNSLYQRALFGLKLYTQTEIKEMHWQKRKRIQKVHKRTQKELNLWKQEKLISLTNKIFGLFSNSSTASEIINVYSEPDPNFVCRASFKDLDICKEQIVDRLLNKGILPHNFHTINNESQT